MAAHLRQELLSEYHDVRTSGLTFYEHPNDPYNQQAMYCGRNLLGEGERMNKWQGRSGRGEGKKQNKPKCCAYALSA